jgi:hypothetical protein
LSGKQQAAAEACSLHHCQAEGIAAMKRDDSFLGTVVQEELYVGRPLLF